MILIIEKNAIQQPAAVQFSSVYQPPNIYPVFVGILSSFVTETISSVVPVLVLSELVGISEYAPFS